MVNERLISERARREKATHSLPPQPGRRVSTSSATTGTEDGLLVRLFFRREIIGAVGKLGVTVPVHSVDVIR
jgi:hypothetical protein